MSHLRRGRALWFPPVSKRLLLLAAVLTGLAPGAAAASERTFLITPAELVSAIDQFNGHLLAESESLPKKVRIFRGGTRFDRVKCPSLSGDSRRFLSQLAVLDNADRAALLAGSKRPRAGVANLLDALGADSWQAPAMEFSSSVPGWNTQALTVGAGLPVFQAKGFGKGGGEGMFAATSPAPGYFRFVLDLPSLAASSQGAFSLVMALTSELPPVRRRKPKATQCFFLMELVPADMEELSRRLGQASVPGRAGERLENLFNQAAARLAVGRNDRAKEALADFAAAVGEGMKGGIDPDVADGLIRQATRIIQGL